MPIDVQAAHVTPEDLEPFDAGGFLVGGRAATCRAVAEESTKEGVLDAGVGLSGWPPIKGASQAPGALTGCFDEEAARAAAADVAARLARSERPVVLAGSAVRSSGALGVFLRVIRKLGVPVCTAWNAGDLLPDDHPQYIGRPGSLGDRAGNFAVQNADLVLVLGCRLNVRQVGYEFRAFAHHACRVVVDIDEAELTKPTIFPDLRVHADVGAFLRDLEIALDAQSQRARDEWLDWCRERRRRYPVVSPRAHTGGPVDPYVFVRELAEQLEEHDVVVCANGSACVVTIQAFAFKQGQRLLVNSGTAGMGYDLPAALGAAFARRGGSLPVARGAAGRVICLAGDGSIQMNLQELQTIRQHGLPVKVFVFDNDGYASIRQTQDNLFAGHRVGEGPASGVTFPDLVAIARAYGIEAARVTCHDELDAVIAAALGSEGPSLVDVVMDPARTFTPRVMAERRTDGTLVSKPLEDMFPFLERDEFDANMIGPHCEPEEG